VGPLHSGPFEFSLKGMNAYYRALMRFYGAIFFLGFYNAFPPVFGRSREVEVRVHSIENWIASVVRWPEIVTFEEMNVRPPLFFMFHAVREAIRAKGEELSYGQILTEMKDLA